MTFPEDTTMRTSLLIVLIALCWPLPANAQYRHRYDDRANMQQAPQRPYPGRSGEDGHDPGDRRGSLTPDERRELHRDLQRANREIYRKGKGRPDKR
jgi:hypothetical protein